MNMRTFLLNDTRGIGHLGCDLTVRALLRQCERVGLTIVGTSPVVALDDPLRVRSQSTEFDLLLINGEGSMHDDQPKSLSLASAGELAAAAGKRVVLVNSVWEGNRQANRLLPRLEVIACRESLSTDLARQEADWAETVPDALFSLERPAQIATTRSSNLLITDSVIGSVTRRLAWLACRHGCMFAPLWRNTITSLGRRRFLSRAVRWRCPPMVDPLSDEYLWQLSEARSVVAGRFHAACLALWLDVPVAAIASNTHKVQGLFHDAGCDANLIRRWPGGSRRIKLGDFQPLLANFAENRSATRKYVVEAKTKIERLFDRIANLQHATPRRAAS